MEQQLQHQICFQLFQEFKIVHQDINGSFETVNLTITYFHTFSKKISVLHVTNGNHS